jgi:hypothetical protein
MLFYLENPGKKLFRHYPTNLQLKKISTDFKGTIRRATARED